MILTFDVPRLARRQGLCHIDIEYSSELLGKFPKKWEALVRGNKTDNSSFCVGLKFIKFRRARTSHLKKLE